MKRIVIWLIALGCGMITHADESRFLQANKLYADKRYQEARETYEAIIPRNSVTWFNLGCCWYQQENFSQAVLAWSRAQRGASPAVYCAAQDAIKMLCAQQNSVLDVSAGSLLRGALVATPVLFWQILFLLLWWGAALVIFARLCAISWVGILMIMLSIAVSGLLLHKRVSYEGDYAVVMEHDSIMRAGPGLEYHFLTKNSPQAPLYLSVVRLLEEREQWCLIRAQETAGWIECAKIERV